MADQKQVKDYDRLKLSVLPSVVFDTETIFSTEKSTSRFSNEEIRV